MSSTETRCLVCCEPVPHLEAPFCSDACFDEFIALQAVLGRATRLRISPAFRMVNVTYLDRKNSFQLMAMGDKNAYEYDLMKKIYETSFSIADDTNKNPAVKRKNLVRLLANNSLESLRNIDATDTTRQLNVYLFKKRELTTKTKTRFVVPNYEEGTILDTSLDNSERLVVTAKHWSISTTRPTDVALTNSLNENQTPYLMFEKLYGLGHAEKDVLLDFTSIKSGSSEYDGIYNMLVFGGVRTLKLSKKQTAQTGQSRVTQILFLIMSKSLTDAGTLSTTYTPSDLLVLTASPIAVSQ